MTAPEDGSRTRAAGHGRGIPARAPQRRIGGTIEPARYVAIAVATFVVLVLLWTAVTALSLVDPLFLPSPVTIVERFGTQIDNGQLASDTAISLYRIMVGYALATMMALPLGILMGAYRVCEAALEPLVDFIRYMPVVAFVPLSILWIGTEDSQKFLIIWMGTFFQQVLLIMDATRRVELDLIDLGRTLGMNDRKILRRIVLPAAAPEIWDALRISLGWAWTWLVLAELVAATSGLGYRITLAQRYFETDTIIAYVIVLGILGLISDQLMRALGRRFFSYQRVRKNPRGRVDDE